MAQPVTMPKMGYEMLEGTIVRWLKRVGEHVATGEPIAEIETAKAIVELEAPADGTLLAINAPEGSLVPVDGVVAHIGAPGEISAPQEPLQAPARPSTPSSPIERPTTQGLRTGFPPRLPDATGNIILGPMGEAIARRTQNTIRDVPHFYVSVTIDMTDALAFRRGFNQSHPGSDHISVNDLIIKATTLALLKYPVFNSTYQGDHLSVHPHVNMGIAIALPKGLIVPAILNCELRSLTEIAHASRDLAARASVGTLRQAEYTGTFSISNLGMYGVDSFTAIIVAPQVGVLSVSSVQTAPQVVGNEIVIRRTMNATLGIDHRAAHGAEGAQFTAELKRLLETPTLLGH